MWITDMILNWISDSHISIISQILLTSGRRIRSTSKNMSRVEHLCLWLFSSDSKPSACTISYVLGYVGNASHLNKCLAIHQLKVDPKIQMPKFSMKLIFYVCNYASISMHSNKIMWNRGCYDSSYSNKFPKPKICIY